MTLSNDKNWWRQAVIYQIYPRSFADSNGDGIGDLKGITSRVDYLASLGLDAVWLSPFYPSALADGGYDVDDYRDVDPKLGTLADFDEMIAALHGKGIRVFVDIVPNHSSDRHVWFQEALASEPGSAARNRYIFRDGKGPNGDEPPSDWPSHFAPRAWTRTTNPDGTPGQWYCHLFAPEQPDFNWDNPEIHEDFKKTLRFWSDRGVDGFRIDVAHALKKDLSEPLRSKPAIVDSTTRSVATTHCLTATTFTRSTASGASYSTSTTRPALPLPRRTFVPSVAFSTQSQMNSVRHLTLTCSSRRGTPRNIALTSTSTSSWPQRLARRRLG